MIGIILIAHKNIGKAFLEVVEFMCGPQSAFKVIEIDSLDNIEEQRQLLLDTIDYINDGDGVILLTDLFGGTPSNLAISMLSLRPVEVIAGLNLPMLLNLINSRTQITTIKDAVESAKESGKKYIRIASHFLNNN